LLLLDEQSGPFEHSYWKAVFSPGHPILRASDIQRSGSPRVRLRRPLFVPPGYSNILLSHVTTEGDCHAGTQLFQSFRRFFLAGLGLGALTARATSFPDRIRVTFVSRRPYSAHGVDHPFMGRQIDNEGDLLTAMQADARVSVERVDFATVPPKKQLETVAKTEIMVRAAGGGGGGAPRAPPPPPPA
jgi:hypothetical protein